MCATTCLVSVVIPHRNRAAFLADALRSACQFPAAEVGEVLVCDNGSSDDSAAVVREMQRQDPRVRWLDAGSEAGLGNRARNLGLQAARGKFVQFLDSDDLLLPDKISAQLQRLADRQNNAMATCAWAWIYATGRRQAVQPPRYWRDYSRAVDLLGDMWMHCGWFYTGCWLVPREIALQVGGWDESLRADQDGDFFARVMGCASEVLFVPETGFLARRHALGQVGDATSDEAWRSRLLSWRKGSTILRSAWPSSAAERAIRRRLRLLAYRYAITEKQLHEAAELDKQCPGRTGWFFPPQGLGFLADVLGLERAIRLRRRLWEKRKGTPPVRSSKNPKA